jgi:hypothetical protein
LESAADSEDGSFLDFFGYQSKALEPRLYGLPYSRKLHEQLEKEVMPKLKGGQIAKGRLKAVKSIQGNKQEGDSKKSHGGESQKQEWQFHELLPSELHRKPSYGN